MQGSELNQIQEVLNNEEALQKLKEEEELKKYETLDRYPGTIWHAKCHLLANKFGFVIDEGNNGVKKCPCCQEFVENNTFEFIFNEDTLKRLTSGVTMFFYTIKIFVIYLAMKFIISDIFNLYMNFSGNYCEINPKFNCSMYVKLSIDNRTTSTAAFSSIQIQQILDFVTVIASIIYFIVFKKLISSEFSVLDQSMQTQDDYTMYITNLPIYIRDSKESKGTYQDKLKHVLVQQVKDWIKANLDPNEKDKPYQNYFQNFKYRLQQYNQIMKEQYQKNKAKHAKEPVYRKVQDFLSDDPYNIIVENGIQLCWNMHEFEVLEQLKETLKDQGKKMFDKLQKYQKNPDKIPPQQDLEMVKSRIADVKFNIKTVNQQILNLSKQFGNPKRDLDFFLSHYIGKALVKFEYEHFAEYIGALIEDGDLYIKDTKLHGDKAAAPSDIFWKNLALTNREKNSRTFVAFLITLGSLVVSLGLLIAISYGKELLYKNLMAANATAANNTLILSTNTTAAAAPGFFAKYQLMIKTTALSIGTSIVIVIVNYILKRILLALSEYERKESRTEQLIAFIWKLLVAQFVNTALIYYFTCELILKFPHHAENGITNSVSSLFTTSSAIQILLNIGNPFLFLAIFTMRFLYGDKNAWDIVRSDYNFNQLQKTQKLQNTHPEFQDRLNKKFELPLFAIEERYVYYLLQIYIIAFYGFLIPVGTPIMIIVFIIQFFIDRLNLLRFSTLQVQFDFGLTRFIYKLFESSIFITSIGNFIMSYNKIGNITVFPVISLAVSVVYMLLIYVLPQKFQAKIFSSVTDFEKTPYSAAVNSFKQTYENENPGTRLYSAPSTKHKASISSLVNNNPAEEYI